MSTCVFHASANRHTKWTEKTEYAARGGDRYRGGGVVGGRRVCDVTKPIKDATAKITRCQGQLQVGNRSRSSSSKEEKKVEEQE